VQAAVATKAPSLENQRRAVKDWPLVAMLVKMAKTNPVTVAVVAVVVADMVVAMVVLKEVEIKVHWPGAVAVSILSMAILEQQLARCLLVQAFHTTMLIEDEVGT
jgi:hypothetical protein